MQEDMAVKFYILVPIYKTEKYICQCVESILNQTYSNFEVVLVNDGSPDQAGKICDEFAQVDSRIHVIHKMNEGLLAARRAAISYVKANCSQEDAFFVFVDSDDYLESDALDILARIIRGQCCDLVIYGIQCVCDGKVISGFEQESYIGSIADKRDLYKRVFFDMQYNSLCRKAVSCMLCSNDDWHIYYHIRHGEDLLQSIPIYKNCRKAEFIDSILYNYRMNPASITHSISLNSYTVNSTVRRTVWEFLQKENVLTAQDMEEYLQQCRFFLRKQLLTVCSLSGKYAEYCAILEKFRQDSYYSMLLEGNYKDFLLTWLKNGDYVKIVIFAKVRGLLSKCYHVLKGMVKI